ncbi:hypothetical protein ACJJTC_017656 [Scirpophaga incertulas]
MFTEHHLRYVLPHRGILDVFLAPNTRAMTQIHIFVSFLLILVGCECVYIYSSFWAPLFNPRILNFRVDTPFEPNAGKAYREQYIKNYGVKGERLIADLGNGKGPADIPLNKNTEEVKFYYTYSGAERENVVQ